MSSIKMIARNLFLLVAASVAWAAAFKNSGTDNETAAAVVGEMDNLRFTFGNNTYEISSAKAPWVSAKNDCRKRGMELVSIETYEEDVAIRAAISEFPETFWTSGNDNYQEGYFYWDSTGEAFTYKNWAPGNPNNAGSSGSGQQCVSLWHSEAYRWDDSLCVFSCRYICEKKPHVC